MMFEEVFEDDDVAYLLCGSPGKGDGPPGRLPRWSVGWMLISGALRMPYRVAGVGQDEKQGLVEGRNLYIDVRWRDGRTGRLLLGRSVSTIAFASFFSRSRSWPTLGTLSGLSKLGTRPISTGSWLRSSEKEIVEPIAIESNR